MKFSEVLDEYLELKATGPDESEGFTDKRFHKRIQELQDHMNKTEIAIKALSDIQDIHTDKLTLIYEQLLIINNRVHRLLEK
jgi:predicted ribosome quality control (RQC) complex YloA/Tae2 family protein